MSKKNSELLKLYKEYTIQNKVIDYDTLIPNMEYVKKLISIVSKTDHIEKYIKKSVLRKEHECEEGESVFATYTAYDKKITVYKKGIKELYSSIANKDELTRFLEGKFYLTASFTQIILHELEHAHQQKIIMEEDSTRAMLLYLSSLGSTDTEETYKLSLKERQAEIKSHRRILNLLNKLNEQYYLDRLCMIEYSCFLESQINGYTMEDGIIKCPTLEHFRLTGQIEGLIDGVDWYNEDERVCLETLKKMYSTYQRINLGLPIDESEYNYHIDLIKKYRGNLK